MEQLVHSVTATGLARISLAAITLIRLETSSNSVESGVKSEICHFGLPSPSRSQKTYETLGMPGGI
jgi:hypothetical protein